MTKSKLMCAGCYDDDYNHGLGGAKECWLYKNATIEKKISVHINQPPPYDITKAQDRMSCYNQKQWVFVKPEALSEKGYWK